MNDKLLQKRPFDYRFFSLIGSKVNFLLFYRQIMRTFFLEGPGMMSAEIKHIILTYCTLDQNML
ncbi:MAG: hypothetical protein A2W86_07720 [Bacteroidetes bacterium GWD2_45_23]|nr:MAG: hypothetical protein A2W87_04075 [Bacteroidetes bacterium GWC2_46_850]OFX74494.1 MAG: hypothetical protein A2071_01320 [Bacteroidetes bacterium GWC1_47_7]OFX82445.1 MAG: hypothetical protein A2W86_07720 [Bacteroidetes bacterium GWD2_45_23]HAR39160.1 hypothetical protein [Porphyromonadaceae bacterium]HBB01100.1 hypothetical protein [Porphyromonadaceae bacterium]